MKSLRTRLSFTHALVAIIGVAIVAVLATVLIRAAFNRFAPQAAANNLAEVLDFSLKGRSAPDYNVPQITSPPCPIITSRRR